MGIPMFIRYFVEPVPMNEPGFRRWRVVQRKAFGLMAKKGKVDASSYAIVSLHWTRRGAENRASGMNQTYGRG